MHRVALALLWIVFSTWYSYCLRPVEWPALSIEPAQAHVGLMSTLFPKSRMQQTQALFDAGVPVASGKGFEIPQEGGTIHFPLHRLPMRIQDFYFRWDGSGKTILWIHSAEEN
jgi:hypothetical protein